MTAERVAADVGLTRADGTEKATYDVENGALLVRVPKATRGELFTCVCGCETPAVMREPLTMWRAGIWSR